MKDKHFRNIMIVLLLVAVVILTTTIIASNQLSRDLDQLMLDIQEIEELSLQLEKESETILNGLEELHSDDTLPPGMRYPLMGED